MFVDNNSLHARHQAIVQARRRRQRRAGTVAAGAGAAAGTPSPPPPPGPAGPNSSRPPTASAAAAARTSLIPDTLRDMAEESPEERALRERTATAQGRALLAREERAARRRSLAAAGAPPFGAALASRGLAPLSRGRATVLQLNVGLRCNQACSHCHVESSPLRTEEMSAAVADRCLELLRRARAEDEDGGTLACLDLTGGAPEMSSQFRPLVREASRIGVQVIDRCNLTVLTEPGQEDLAAFLAEHKVRVVASLPCYGASNVDAQRGRGVFERSIEGLRMLNAVGYGMTAGGNGGGGDGGGGGGEDAAGSLQSSPSSSPNPTNNSSPPPPLRLDLVYNPGGAFLAPPSSSLEPAYRRELREAHGVEFNSLLCLNNLPIKRFADWLSKQQGGKGTESYLRLLVDAFNPDAVGGLMCRDTVSVSYDGKLYDCDFNQQLAMAMVAAEREEGGEEGVEEGGGGGGGAAAAAPSSSRRPLTVFDIEDLSELEGRPVATDSHCYGCTAGQGSGCQGATTA